MIADTQPAPRTLRRALRLPTDADVARLLAAGWCPTPRLGWWQRGAATAPRWWQAALAPEGR